MRITFLGHQGWQIENNKGHSFLLDPILEAMGNGPTRLPVWPQRRLDFSKMAPIDGVIISHEHADHFSLETLHALPKRCPVYVTDLASFAMCSAIQEMGFLVQRFKPLEPFAISGIKITALPALYNKLEPDVYALLMQDDSAASFLTAIDTIAHPDIFAWLQQHCPQRTLDNLTNNFVEPRQPLVNDPNSHHKSRATVMANALEFVERFQPKRAVVSGQGWCFTGEHAKFNHSFFSVQNDWLTQTAKTLTPHVEWWQGLPGMRFELKGDDVKLDMSNVMTMFESADRTFIPESVRETEPFAPWSGNQELDTERLSKVQTFIREEFANVIAAYSPKIIEALYYLKFQDCGQLNPTLSVVLRNGDQRYIYEFDYGLLVFHDATATTQQPSVFGIELWASDMELMLSAEEESFMIFESAVRSWSYMPTFFDASGLNECFMWFTPRFRPKETLAFYRRKIATMEANGN